MYHFYICLCISLLVLTGCSGDTDKTDAPEDTTQFVVSIAPLKPFLQKLVGPHATVHVLLPDGANPHTYSPTPQHIEKIAAANAYFYIGMPFETRVLDKITSLAPDSTRVNLREGISLLSLEEGHTHTHDHAHGESCGGELDPHIWLSPLLMKKIVATMARTTQQIMPARSSDIVRIKQETVKELDALHTELDTELSGLKNKSFLVFHPAWRYFAREYGLKELTVEHEGNEPGPRALEKLIEQAEEAQVKVLIAQPQFSTRLAEIVAEKTGTKIVIVNPLSAEYAKTLRTLADALKEYE